MDTVHSALRTFKTAIRVRLQTAAQRRREGEREEVAFWDQLIRTGGGEWAAAYAERLVERPLQPRPAALLPNTQAVSILDVGAGPLTVLGTTVAGKLVKITAVDPLAGEYDAILCKYGVHPLVRTENLAGEALTSRFAPNTFDLSYARNCLDHSNDPMLAIQQMIAVTKIGGYVLLEHATREADRSHFGGLHQWNFSLNAGGEFIIEGRHGKAVNVSTALKGVTVDSTEVVENGFDYIIVTIQKGVTL